MYIKNQNQCCGSGSVEAVCFLGLIRIRHYFVRIRILPSSELVEGLVLIFQQSMDTGGVPED